jgi:hypothetical protein
MYRWEVSSYRRVAVVLMRLELITESPDFTLFETYRFTSKGKKVRAHLLAEKYDQPMQEWNWEETP